MSTSIIKKMTVRALVGDVSKLAREHNDKEGLENGEKLDLCRIIGQAMDMKPGTSEYGDFVEFKGQFKGVSVAGKTAGFEATSFKCFLPEIAADQLAAQLDQEGVNTVQFAFDISIVGNEKSATGYEYVATPLIDEGQSDPLAALESQLSAPALPSAE